MLGSTGMSYSPCFEGPTVYWESKNWGCSRCVPFRALHAKDHMHGPDIEDSRFKVGGIRKSWEEED